jgi:hypothetical protein
MYMKDVLKFDIKQNGFFMMLPHIPVLFANLPFSYLTDVIRRKRILSTGAMRKLNQTVAAFGCCSMLIGQSFVDESTRYVAVVINVFVALLMNVVARAGYLVNSQDIAPMYSGEVLGISNTFATLSGIIAPIVCSSLTPNGTADEWKAVFYIGAAFIAIGGTVFVIFGQGEVLEWAKDAEAEILPQQQTVIEATTVSNGHLDAGHAIETSPDEKNGVAEKMSSIL